MRSATKTLCLLGITTLAFAVLLAQTQRPAPTTAQSTRGHFISVNRRVLEMAKDFPEDKYGYRLKPEMRSFSEVMVHITSGTIYAAKIGRGEKANWDELDPKNYPTKAAVVALIEKANADAEAVVKGLPDDSFTKSVEPWTEVMEHTAEHYGLLVAYYRANGLVPPASRPKPAA
jgi:hypothetical protein